MKHLIAISLFSLLTVLALAGIGRAGEPVSATAFNYRGELKDDGIPANGLYELCFELYDRPLDGTRLGSLTLEGVEVVDGRFEAELDFGLILTSCAERWLQTRVRRSGDKAFTTLKPRQPLMKKADCAVDGNLTVSGTLNAIGLRTEGDAAYPNVIGGSSYNTVDAGIVVATISGGGTSSHPNRITADYGTVGGGYGNTASSSLTTVSGGYGNEASGQWATVGGGSVNTASGSSSTVSGGATNMASGHQATVSGGVGNTASAPYATVSGGLDNTASGYYSFAAGRQAEALHSGTFVWADNSTGGSSFSSTAVDQFLVRAAGGVGLGTNAPVNQLHVQAALNSSGPPSVHVAQIENTSTGTSADVLALKIGRTDNPGTLNNYLTFYNGDDDAVGAIEGDGSGGISLRSGSGDVAELLPRLDPQEQIEPGAIVGVFGGQVSTMTADADRLMVVSSRPIVLGNDPGEDRSDAYEKVAFIGQVEVKVYGPVRTGDAIVPSGLEDGSGIAVDPELMSAEQLTRVVGQAWQSSAEPGLKLVRVAVGLGQPAPEMTRRLSLLQAENRELEAEIAELRKLVESLAVRDRLPAEGR